MNFTRQLWQDNESVWQAILAMPFISRLKDGSLPLTNFQYYIIQDAHYLIDYAKALAIAAAKTDEQQDLAFLAMGAHNAIAVEKSLHTNYLQLYGITPADFKASSPAPTCFTYTQYLIATASVANFSVAMAALLPCFWVYAAVGKELTKQTITAKHPYYDWIKTYSGEDFNSATNIAIDIVERHAQNCSPQQLQQMRQAFKRAFEFEWRFWHAADQLENWPKII